MMSELSRPVPSPKRHAVVVQRLLQAGWSAVGKTQTVELAYGGWGTNRAVGAPWNPWDAAVHRALDGDGHPGTAAGAPLPLGRRQRLAVTVGVARHRGGAARACQGQARPGEG